jgi:hypothetical protein|nr:MAG TPA: hypothetical protein [Caudoviricetes sp.]
MEIITGYVGKKHVTSEQERDVNQGIVGPGSYVLKTGMQMEAEVSSNNEIKIRDGVLMHQGCAASIKKNTYDSLTIINGSQGMKRIDLIVARYEKNRDDETESLNLEVIQGTPAESNPAVPEYTEGSIQAGDYIADMPMYQVIINGLNITEVKRLFEVEPDIDTLKKEFAELNGKSGKLIENQIDYQEYTLLGGKVKVISGSVIRKGAGKNYIALFTAEQLKDYFGVTVNTTRLSISTFNGDDTSQAVQFYAPENWQGSIYQYFSAVVSGSIRINYRMVYVYE